MMRSLSSAVAGLRTHQTKMDVIGNNIANVNTYGYKASRTTFADVFYQNLATGSGPTTTTGGTNPTQIGYGASVATIDILNTQAGATTTDRALDVYITGDGFLVTQDATGNFLYTRLGNMGFDAEGNLIDSNGNYVMGFPQREDGSAQISADGTATGTELKNIKVDPSILDQLTGISISKTGEIIGQLPGDTKITLGSGLPSWFGATAPSIPETSNWQGPVKLTVGGLPAPADLATIFTVGGTALPITKVSFGDIALDETYPPTISIDANGMVTMTAQTLSATGVMSLVTATGSFDKDGKLTLTDNNKKTIMTIETSSRNFTLDTIAAASTPTNAAVEAEAKRTYELANPGLLWESLDPTADATTIANHKATAQATLTVNATSLPALTKMYQLVTKDKGGNVVNIPDGPTSLASATGYPAGGVGNWTIGDITFSITREPTAFSATIGQIGMETGETINIGCIVLAKFRNAAGLMQAGSSKYVETANSGEAIFVRPGLEGTGSLLSSNLEMSNVDISKEFTDMITTQRGFQANSRIVTVSDEMLQELVNLKR